MRISLNGEWCLLTAERFSEDITVVSIVAKTVVLRLEGQINYLKIHHPHPGAHKVWKKKIGRMRNLLQINCEDEYGVQSCLYPKLLNL